MEVTVLGSGTGVPSLRRGSPGILVKVSDKVIVMDMGSGTLGKLLKVGVKYTDPDAILLSHFHPDHTADLVPFLFACKYSLEPREKDLLLLGGKGLREYYEGLKSVHGHWVKAEGFRLRIQEVFYGERDLGGIRLITLPMDHTRGSIGYRLEAEGKSIAYSGDTDYAPEVVELVKEVDLAILECSFPEGRKVKGHLTPHLAGRIAQEGGAKKLLLTHFYPPCDEVDVVAQCQEVYDGEVIKAEDLLSLKV